jgi:hypothetical protein
MSKKKLAVLSGLMLATSPVLAQDPATNSTTGAPPAGPNAKYCMRIAPATGSLVEVVRCWTRDQWSDQGVDVDKAWAEEGVSVREDGMGLP